MLDEYRRLMPIGVVASKPNEPGPDLWYDRETKSLLRTRQKPDATKDMSALTGINMFGYVVIRGANDLIGSVSGVVLIGTLLVLTFLAVCTGAWLGVRVVIKQMFEPYDFKWVDRDLLMERIQRNAKAASLGLIFLAVLTVLSLLLVFLSAGEFWTLFCFDAFLSLMAFGIAALRPFTRKKVRQELES